MTRPALILVAEDEAALRQDICEELGEAGYRVLAAGDGRQALGLLEQNTPDLVLCDITMPELDGFGLLAALRRSRPDLASVPFVFLTALSEPAEVIEGKRMGADDYLVKPVDYDLMLATIAARLRQVARIRSRHGDEIEALRRDLSRPSAGIADAALDLIAMGVVLLDRQGHVLFANRAAREMAESGSVITIGSTRFAAADPEADRALQRAIAAALRTAAAGSGDRAGVLLPGDTDQAVSVSVCALPENHPDEAGPTRDRPRVALFLPAPVDARHVSEPLLCDLFGLTPTEARVAAALTGGTRPADIAARLGVSQTTIAFHMRNLFQKTGTNRQSDLIALILSGPAAVR